MWNQEQRGKECWNDSDNNVNQYTSQQKKNKIEHSSDNYENNQPLQQMMNFPPTSMGFNQETQWGGTVKNWVW